MHHRDWACVPLLVVLAACGQIEQVPHAQPPDAGLQVPDTHVASAWSTSVVFSPDEPSGLPGDEIAIMVDRDGALHIASNVYALNGALRHAWIAGGEFQTEIIDPEGRNHVSWVLNSEQLRLVYNNFGYTTTLFRAEESDTGAWAYDRVSIPNRSAAIAGVWKEDALQLAYLTQIPVDPADPFGNLRRHTLIYAGEEVPLAGTGLTRTFEPAFMAVALDPSGAVHFLYTASPENLNDYEPCGDCGNVQNLRYVNHSSSGWSEPETVTLPGYYTGLSMLVDATGGIHATLRAGDVFPSPGEPPSPTRNIQYLSRVAGATSWQTSTLVESENAIAWPGSLALDQQGRVHLVYCSNDDAAVPRCDSAWHLYQQDGAWLSERIDSGCERLGNYAAIASGPDDVLHVAYEGCEGQLMYATRPAP
jgi:hypothetical protein